MFNRCFATSFLLFSLLGLNACTQDLQNKLAPDPELKETSETTEPVAEKPTPTPTPTTEEFPEEIPSYPKAELLETKPAGKGTLTRWQSEDPSNSIASFYQEEFQNNDWEIASSGEEDSPIVASKNGLEVKVSVVNPTTPEEEEKGTAFLVEYQREAITVKNKPVEKNAPQEFSDLEKVNPQLTEYIQDLGQLGVFASSSNKNQDEKFQPNQTITRRDYANWLVTANNLLHENIPSKQIRLIEDAQQPAFQDVKKSDPDFAVIQGLAEAGLIPSSLTGNIDAGLFRPDAPLTREDLIWWKVPLDTRQALPKTTLDSIQQTWGFQDASKVNPQVLPALYLDFQNGEQANIRRTFGYTTIFQPKKPVTRAEAAATLWYFGFQGEGITAQEALKIDEP
ncbi:MAG: S-layer homology domain-containing protein [Spirulinaceae cyanobacterium]